MTAEIEAAINGFRETVLGGIPVLLQQNRTAFLSFMCQVAAVDALAAYRYADMRTDHRFPAFVRAYFPETYVEHAENLYILRCRLLHNFSPARFSLVHGQAARHLQPSDIGDTILSDDAFFRDLRVATETFFNEVSEDPERQRDMQARLVNIDRGGAIYSW